MFGLFKKRISLIDFTQAALREIALPGLNQELEKRLGDFDKEDVLTLEERIAVIEELKRLKFFAVQYFLFREMSAHKIPMSTEEDPAATVGRALVRELVRSLQDAQQAEQEYEKYLAVLARYLEVQAESAGLSERQCGVAMCASFADDQFTRGDQGWAVCLRLATRYWGSTIIWLEEVAKQYRIVISD